MRTLPLALVLVPLFLAPGCALRPRYNELVPRDAAEGQTLAFQVVDKKSGAPLANVPVVIGEGPSRVRAKTDRNGVFTLPARAGLRSTDPVLEVTLPAGVAAYEVKPAGVPPQSAPGEAAGAAEAVISDPTGLLSGCRVEPAPAGVSVECPELMAVVAEGEPGADAWGLAEKMVEEFTRDFVESFGGEVRREELQVDVAGAARRGLRFESALPDDAVIGTVVALEPVSAEAAPRAVLCLFVGAESRPCAPVVELLATKPPEPGLYGP